MIVIGIILIFGGLGGLISKSYAGGLAVLALGVVLLVLGIKRKKKTPKPVPQPQPVSQPPVQPQPRPVPPPTPQPAPQPVVVRQPVPQSSKKVETHRVAGMAHYKDAIESLGEENPVYDYSKREIVEDGMEDEQIFRLDFDPMPVEFVFEPENEFDPNAIAIVVNGEKIGYVKKGSTGRIRNLLKSGTIEKATVEIKGGKYKIVDSEDGSIDRDEMDYRADVNLILNDDLRQS